MSYTPLNVQTFVAAMSGSLSGIGIGERPITSTNPDDYNGLALSAFAYAQEFDTQWGSSAPDTLEWTTMSAWYNGFLGERPNMMNLSATKSQLQSTQLNILPFGQGAKRTWPVVIVVDSVVDRVADLLTGVAADGGRDQTLERRATSVAEDHLLFCDVAPNADRLLTSFRGRFAKRHSIQVLDWLGVPISDPPLVKDYGGGEKIRSDVSAAIYQQCPRRAFYEAILRRKVTRITAALEVFNYPAMPADEGLCVNCEFDAVCPSEL